MCYFFYQTNLCGHRTPGQDVDCADAKARGSPCDSRPKPRQRIIRRCDKCQAKYDAEIAAESSSSDEDEESSSDESTTSRVSRNSKSSAASKTSQASDSDSNNSDSRDSSPEFSDTEVTTQPAGAEETVPIKPSAIMQPRRLPGTDNLSPGQSRKRGRSDESEPAGNSSRPVKRV